MLAACGAGCLVSVKYIQPHISPLQGCAGSSWLPFVPSTNPSHGCWAFLSSLSQNFSCWVKPMVKTLTAVTFKASWHFCIGNKCTWTSESIRHPNMHAFYYIRLHLSPLKMQMMLLTWRVIFLRALLGRRISPWATADLCSLLDHTHSAQVEEQTGSELVLETL